MPTRRQLIQKITLNSNASSVTFSNIPQNYTDLKLVVSARTDHAAYFDNALIRFNGDSGSNYSWRGVYGLNGSTYSDYVVDTGFQRVYATGSSATSGTFGHTIFSIPQYSGSTVKACSTSACTESNISNGPIVYNGALLWNSTSAITSINITSSNLKNFLAGSTFYLYGITHVPIIRGGEEYVSSGFKYHKFTSTAALQVIEPGDVEYLIVAGGGAGGGYFYGGGGGAGGVAIGRTRTDKGNHAITIGAGGTGTSLDNYGTDGVNSTLGSLITAIGGGSGGAVGQNGKPGGSGGGGGGHGGLTAGTGGAGTTGQGNSGGTGYSQSSRGGGAGGGGASASGTNGAYDTGGTGGAGRAWDGTYYGGGGGGGTYEYSSSANAGGIGGGGSGSAGGAARPALSGQANTGGGGGGWSSGGAAGPSGNGGSGIIIIRYPYDGN